MCSNIWLWLALRNQQIWNINASVLTVNRKMIWSSRCLVLLFYPKVPVSPPPQASTPPTTPCPTPPTTLPHSRYFSIYKLLVQKLTGMGTNSGGRQTFGGSALNISLHPYDKLYSGNKMHKGGFYCLTMIDVVIYREKVRVWWTWVDLGGLTVRKKKRNCSVWICVGAPLYKDL